MLTDLIANALERLANFAEAILPGLILVIIIALPILLWIGVLSSAYSLLVLPMKRREGGRILLDIMETALDAGRGPEDAIIELSFFRDWTVGSKIHRLANHLKQGVPLGNALARVPRLLPAQITAMLQVGMELGDVRKVLPACRSALASGSSRVQGGFNYLLVFPPLIPLLTISAFLSTVVFPKLQEILKDLLGGQPLPASTTIVARYLAYPAMPWTAAAVIFLVTVTLLFGGLVRAPRWLRPSIDRLFYHLPWRRKRMQRDFSAMLAVLLDAGVPEHKAVTMAAESTANLVFIRRARAVAQRLQEGVKLTEAVAALDDAGEFRWRLTNAAHGQGGFMEALAGWHDALDAKAYQQEQAVSQIVTTGLVIFNGLMVGLVWLAVFQPLIKIAEGLSLW